MSRKLAVHLIAEQDLIFLGDVANLRGNDKLVVMNQRCGITLHARVNTRNRLPVVDDVWFYNSMHNVPDIPEIKPTPSDPKTKVATLARDQSRLTGIPKRAIRKVRGR